MDGPDCPMAKPLSGGPEPTGPVIGLLHPSLIKPNRREKNISCKCQGGTAKLAWYCLSYVIQGPSLLTAAWRHCGILAKTLVWSGETRLTENPSQTYYTHTCTHTFSSAL